MRAISRGAAAWLRAGTIGWAACAGLALAHAAAPVMPPDAADPAAPHARAALRVDSVATHRFLAAHGRRAVMMGYADAALEFWAYPLQIASGYRLGFRSDGGASEVDARGLLSRIVATPEGFTRIYAGPDYVVRESVLVALDQAAARVRYEVDSAQPLDIIVHLEPVLDLMWPAALGGQRTRWMATLPGYLLDEPAHGFSAAIASNQIVAHDAPLNSTLRAGNGLALVLRPEHAKAGDSSAQASLLLAQVDSEAAAPARVHELIADAAQWQSAAAQHYRELQADAVQIETPDAKVNAALAWATIALDQAWICNPDLGCALGAGYGPSRAARRPQYDWFFAGDGMVGVDAWVATGAYARARAELEFIARYQDQTSGMVWHELAQSTKYVDWKNYGYLFVHVDISFDYLHTLARYVKASGDEAFAAQQWASIAAAYRYCQSLIGADHLPHIPPGKQAGDEQHKPVDDLGLSVAWVEAARSFAELARAAGHAQLADAALAQSALAQNAIAPRYWDTKTNFWIAGHEASGAPMLSRAAGPGSAIGAGVFSAAQNNTLLDQIASANFQTDWGARGLANDSPIFAPWSYATGSIFAIHTAQTAQTFWQAHRPATAWPIWRSQLAWADYDAPGHLHEVFAGNYFRAQSESVPEQTWSSSALLATFVGGVLGIDIDAANNTLHLHPHLPADWPQVTVEHLHLPHSSMGLRMQQDATQVVLDLHNDGAAAKLDFAPQIALGAQIEQALCNGKPVAASIEPFAQDAHAKLALDIAPGATHCALQLRGGVTLIVPWVEPRVGEPSRALKVTGIHLEKSRLLLGVDLRAEQDNRLRLRTPWRIESVRGATSSALPDGYELQLSKPSAAAQADGYTRGAIEIRFAEP